MEIAPTTFRSLPALRLTAGGAEATILRHGAQLVGWRPAPQAGVDANGTGTGTGTGTGIGAGTGPGIGPGPATGPGAGDERLYLSPLARFDGREAIRGGVPVIFPQFDRTGPDRQLPRHGFARTATWAAARGDGPVDAAVLTLDRGSRADGSEWPYRFRLELGVRLSARSLEIRLSVHNDGALPFAFSTALHSYFAVRAIDAVVLEGLGRGRWTDRVGGADPGPHDAPPDPYVFDREIDRIHHRTEDSGTPLRLLGGPSPLAIDQQGFDETVVWNPWHDRSRAIDDLPDDGFRHFVCVEAARITNPVTLAEGESWHGRQRLEAH
ncbi:MAG: D-hexose-6-phosphate mutarotase [Burkholderiaceae bacterium]